MEKTEDFLFDTTQENFILSWQALLHNSKVPGTELLIHTIFSLYIQEISRTILADKDSDS